MVTVKDQNIKAARYYYYTAYLTEQYNCGFNYYDSEYGYVPLMKVRKRIDFTLPNRRGTDPIKIGVGLASTRVAIKRSALFWAMQPETDGVSPPDTGPRSHAWWTAGMPEDINVAYRWYIKSTMLTVKNYFYPPWGIAANFWIADTDNHRIIRRDTNDFLYTSQYGSFGAGNDDLNHPRGICSDSNYIYIADFGNNRIMIRNKDTLAYINKITSFDTPPKNFIYISDIAVDDKYLYIADRGHEQLIILSKTTFQIYRYLSLKAHYDEVFFVPVSVDVNYHYIYVLDHYNKRIKVFSREHLLLVFYGPDPDNPSFSLNNPTFLKTNSWYLYVTDTGNDRILQFPFTLIEPIRSIGPAGDIVVDLDSPEGVCVSGQYLFISDTGHNRLARVIIDPTEFDAYYGSAGPGTNQFQGLTGLVAEPQHFWTKY